MFGKVVSLSFVTCLLLISAANANAATPEQVALTISRASKFLLDNQKNGNWETVATPDLKDVNTVNGAQWSGPTALAVYALICNGVSPSEPHVASGIDFLIKSSTTGVYALGCRCLVWSAIRLDATSRPIAQRDLKQLLGCMRWGGVARGLFFYVAPVGSTDTLYDHSVSQIAMLGIANIQRAAFEIPSKFWPMADSAWRSQQFPDGGWAYVNNSTKGTDGSETVSMTAAGVATLFLTQESMSHPSTKCQPLPVDPNIAKGIAWLAKNGNAVFDVFNPMGGPNNSYALFTLSRIGAETGLKTFGTVDWYQSGADLLFKTQSPEGTWGGWLGPPQAQASLGLLFLAYGSAPVVINKLDNDTADVSSSRPRDIYHFSQWMGRQIEQRINWQLLSLEKNTVDDLHTAPVLYISGSKAVKFSKDDLVKLKAFAEEGGIIVGVAECNSDAFTTSFLKLGQTLFPAYEFRVLPKEHPIFTNEQYPGNKWKSPPVVRSISNGVREMMILPGGDGSRTFELNDYLGRDAQFQLFADIVNYATDKKGLTKKGITYIVRTDTSIIPTKKLSIARLSYKGNWDPEPAGWRQLAAVAHNEDKLDLTVDPIELGAGKLSHYKLAHLTGTTAVTFNSVQRKEIQDFINAGGTLIVDAAGGSQTFASSIEIELAAITGAAPSELTQKLSVKCDLYQMAGSKIEAFGYREYARDKVVGSLNSGMLAGWKKADRYSVLYSKIDLSAGLVGEAVDGVVGYTPKTAMRLMRNILLYEVNPAATTAATTRPN